MKPGEYYVPEPENVNPPLIAFVALIGMIVLFMLGMIKGQDKQRAIDQRKLQSCMGKK